MINQNKLTSGELIGRILIAAIVLVVVGMFFDKQNKQTTNSTMTNKELLTAVVTKQRKQLPKVIDSLTTWTSIDHSDNELIHGYRFTDIDITKLQQDKIHALQTALPLGLKDYVCKQSVYKKYWHRGIKLTYTMQDNNGKEIARASFTNTECAENDS